MILEKFEKQPREVKDYDVDFSPWLEAMTAVGGQTEIDTLQDVAGTVECLSDPTDQTMLLDRVVFTEMRAKFWMSGGTTGNKYKLTIMAITVGGRKDESELIFTVKDR